ncbi:SIR2 family protein [Variovorax sp. W6]|uniref:SIR2 family protein n=1 Tax=Variovorax sp. W6 TaxID=3093895 RepID=UPI003D8062AA
MTKSQTFNADLVADIARRRVVVFIGAGASKWAKPYSGSSFKDWASFLQDAAKNAPLKIQKLVKERLKSKDYLIASELLKSNLADQWSSILTAEFQQAADVSRLHRAIISLGQRIVVTTNFDKLIENAWNESNASRYPRVISKIDQQAFKLFRDEESYLIKIHGSIDEPENIVFDKTSFQRAAFSNQFYQDLISTLLLTHTFLFIGFSMDDPAVSLLVESHAYRFSDTRPHYAFMAGKNQLEIDNLSKSIRRLFILRYPDANHHSALADQIELLAMQGAQRRKELAISI